MFILGSVIGRSNTTSKFCRRRFSRQCPNTIHGLVRDTQYIVQKILHPILNVSARATVSVGNPIVAGFFVGGDPGTTRTFLCRAIGPTLKSFGVGNALTDPVMAVYDSTGKIVIQNNRGDDVGYATTAQTSASVGALALPTGSKDAAKVVYLAPGAYTLQVTSGDGTSGTALAEVYQVGN